MTRTTPMLILLFTLLSGAAAQKISSHDSGYHATFKASNGDVIKLDTRTGTLETPRSGSTNLQDCSNKFQVCLTDHHGFAFAYFRNCNDDAIAEFGKFKRLRFPPKTVSVLHNSDVWLVFDASPNYLFHYAYSRGIVGINVGPTASFDFRSIFRTRKIDWGNLVATEYRITAGSDAVAACSE